MNVRGCRLNLLWRWLEHHTSLARELDNARLRVAAHHGRAERFDRPSGDHFILGVCVSAEHLDEAAYVSHQLEVVDFRRDDEQRDDRHGAPHVSNCVSVLL